MASVQPLPAPPVAHPQVPAPNGAKPAQQRVAAANPAAIQPSPAVAELPLEDDEEFPELKGPVTRIPVELDVAIPVRNFRVRNLLALAPGALIESQWSNGDDLPLAAGKVQLAWSEFEVLDTGMAARITRLV
ncbi:MAG: FliM/FliN family flagellar motor switch protein [Terracidiphilus sp.]